MNDETGGIVADNERHLPTKRIKASGAFRTGAPKALIFVSCECRLRKAF
jgi:hypothetical protein